MMGEANRLRELLEITRVLTGTSDYAEVLRLVARKAMDLAGADASLLMLAEPGAPASIAAASGTVPAEMGVLPLDEKLVAAVSERFGLGPDDCVVAVPMILRGDVRGTLVVVKRGRGSGAVSRAEDEFLLSALADQAAIALGHSAHLEQLEAALIAAERERSLREETLSVLEAERSWLRAVIAYSPIAVLLVEGAAGHKVTANARAEALFGRSIDPGAGVAQYASQLCDPNGHPLPIDEVPAFQAIRGETVWRELAVRRADGPLTPVLASAAAIRDESHRILGAVVLYQDISALKDLQRLREEWTSIVAHDLRQPVHVVAMAADVLARRVDPVAGREIEVIRTSAERLRRMIDDLLVSSLVEAERLELRREPCGVGPLLADVVGRTPLAPGRVVLRVDDGLPRVDVDRGRIEQVLVNLLTNAEKYGDPDAPIELGARRRDGKVEVTVCNRGLGIAPDRLVTVFERFRRGQSIGLRREGLGLGLYICKSLVEAHGGLIWVESARGTTTFHFTVPASADAG